jgi:integrase
LCLLFLRRMKFVEPIRNRKKIAQIKNVLRGQQRYRDLLLFAIGINTALRISDLLQLQLSQFLDESGKIKSKFWIKEQKRGKRHEIAINQSMKEALIEYVEVYPYRAKATDNFLFFNSRTMQPLKRGQAWKFITKICKEVGLRGNYGTHSLGKLGDTTLGCRGLIWL